VPDDPAPLAARGYLAGFVTDTAGVPIRPIVSPTHPLRNHEVAEQVTVEAENLATGVGWFARTDETGYFRVEVDVGVYEMMALALGFFREEVSGIVVIEGETTTVNFTLAQAPVGFIAGLVTDLHGTPIEGAFVTVSDPVIRHPIGQGFTDASGRFVITGYIVPII